MHFIPRSFRRSHNSRRHHQQQRRCLYDAAAPVKSVRDRGLDHAVERERNLKPVLNLKNLIKSEPSKSLPLSLITQSKEILQIPFRPIEFIRKYPSIFQEFLPGGIAVNPHIKLTPQVIDYDKEEEIIYQSVDYKQEVADRLLKLLMISRINKIPLSIVDSLKWDLGLPQDYVKSIVPEFPDYFKVSNEANEGVLELVCWSNELAVSVVEKKGVVPIEFCLIHSNVFEMDKKYKKWLDEWQKLPYISPYENAQHLAPKSDESDKWAVAVLHEILNIFVGRKAERESVLGLGESFGLRSRFKRALLQHPGIFYVSSKIGTHTVVLKEAYKRGMLVERHPLMEMRFRYAQLMNMAKEDQKARNVQEKTKGNSEESKQDVSLKDDESAEDEDGEMYDLSDEESDDDYEDKDANDSENYQRVNAKSRGRSYQKRNFEGKEHPRTMLRRSAGRNSIDNDGKRVPRLRTEIHEDKDADNSESYQRVNAKSRGRLYQKRNFEVEEPPRTMSRRSAGRNSIDNAGKRLPRLTKEFHEDKDADDSESYQRINAKSRGRSYQKRNFDGKEPPRIMSRSSAGRNSIDNAGKRLPRLTTEFHDCKRGQQRSFEKLDSQGNRSRRDLKKRAST